MTKYVSIKILRVALGIFFLLLGIMGVIPGVQESVFSLNDRRVGIEVIFGIVEIVCGILLIGGLFTVMKKKTISKAVLVVLIFWALRIAATKFIWGINLSSRGVVFEPSFAAWILVLSCEMVIAAALYVVYLVYE